MRVELWEAKAYYNFGDYKKALELANKNVEAYLYYQPGLKERMVSVSARTAH